MTRIEKVTIKGAVIENSEVRTEEGTLDLKNMENIENKAIDFSETDNTKYPTTQAVADYVKGKVSGAYKFQTTINEESEWNALLLHNEPYVTDVEKGYVYNMGIAITYGGKEYPIGTNFAVENAEANPRVMDALAGFVDVSNKTDRLLNVDGHKSYVTNLANDGGAALKFENSDGTWSGIAVNDGGASGLAGQIYAVDGATKTGTRINVTKDKIYYTAGKNTPTYTANDEIATVGGTVQQLGNEAGSGQPYHFPFNITAITPDADKIKVEFDTITLDNNKTIVHYDNLAIPSMDGTNAGLYNKTLADAKLDKLGDVPGAPEGTKYRFPFNFLPPVQSADTISATFQTLILDTKQSGGDYTISIPSAIPLEDKAGLYTKSLADLKTDKTYVDTELAKKVNISDVINDVQHSDDNKPLSAKMGMELNKRIDNISTLGRFLSTWDCATGKPGDEPIVMPYTYVTGDYYVISNVAGEGATNYKPDGTQYIHEQTSTVVEASTVKVNYYYKYTTSGWELVPQEIKSISFGSLAGSPMDNDNLASALNDKSKVTVSATGTATDAVKYITVDGVESMIAVAEVTNAEIDAMWS